VGGATVLVTAVLWVRGLWVLDVMHRHLAYRAADGTDHIEQTSIWSGDGHLGWVTQHQRLSIDRRDEPGRVEYTEWRRERADYLALPPPAPGASSVVRVAEFLGFGIRQRAAGANSTDVLVWLPHWFLLVVGLALFVPPVVYLHRRRVREVRQARGLCVWCGYDLRGSAGRCPECGARAPTGSPR
jgi:hypothetical protein